MDYKEALKKVQTKKVKENYMVINRSYNSKIVLPHKDGLLFLSSLNNAEQLNDPYNETHSITALQKDAISIRPMSCEEYEMYKIASLLKLSIAEVQELGLKSD